ncbi:MAG: type II toxin-antitoxin system RelE/ParE family toxin [Azospirillaceae bacterium]|nr:type II toxin-antitoxin system RelE/ParE family toxin [Azospirillaceae bacterium]
MRFIWTEPAVRDLVSARRHIALENPVAANAQIQMVMLATAQLVHFPRMGREGRWPGTRELVVQKTPYIVAYQIQDDTISILRVLHGRQLWPDPVTD